MALFRWVLIGVALWSAPSAALESVAYDFAPHKAIYDFKPLSIRQGTALSGARGVLTYELQDSCDGWVVDSTLKLVFTYAEGGQVQSSISHLSWEAKDGKSYSFRQRIAQDQEIIEDVDGFAELDLNGGKVTFSQPEEKVISLPVGTLFPSAFLRAALDAGQAGRYHMLAPLFDGGELAGASNVSVLIGKAVNADPKADKLLQTKSYPVRVAYWDEKSQDGVPRQEISTDYFINGLSTRMEFDIEGVRLKGQLRELTSLPRNPC